MITLKQILVPTDFSENSGVAAKYARSMATAFHAELHLMHVLEEPYVAAFDPFSFVPPSNFYEEIEAQTRARLVRLLADWGPQQSHVEIVASRGSPFVEIIRYGGREELHRVFSGARFDGVVPSWADLVAVQIERVEFGV